ncbi:hypothetical protein CJ030_MR5G025044 [Morella rubra]|uniref:Uncharacterized protein n=1 Tax=Morella rubra TaxID=262757 RepID=A0A6A1VKB7_9ROSI|nr:hypothetical protein CJ030_MR5G025044 [Morella rubra]
MKFLYAFWINDRIDLPTHICAHMVKVFHSKSTTNRLPYYGLIMKFLVVNFIFIPHIKPPEKVQNVGKHTLSQSKSNKGHSKSLPSSHPSHGCMQSDMVEAIQLLTERSSSFASALSTLIANQEVLKLDLMKLVADVGLIRKPLKIYEASTNTNPPEEGEKDVEEEEVEEEDEEEEVEEGDDEEEGEEDEGDDVADKGAVASTTSDDE